MASLPAVYTTPEQYLGLELEAGQRHEYVNGRIYDMAGSTPQHNRITVNISSALNLQLQSRGCQVFSIDVRVRVMETDLYTYPDIAVVCGRLAFDERDANTITNPRVIIEVLSPSTEAYDRGEKFAHYKRLPSLTDYLLVAQDCPRIERYTRQDDSSWLLTAEEKMENRVALDAVDVSLTLSDVYAGLDFQ
jgi:Uma2 family endonuclease